MIVWTARTDVLIGYSVFFLVRSPSLQVDPVGGQRCALRRSCVSPVACWSATD